MAISVLIVEDDKNIGDLLQLYLEKEGYAVTIATDGGQGLEKFRAIKPDLVLLDVMMPVMDGWTLCRTIREESQTPIIMLTAKSQTDDKVAGLKSGADDYITKPFEFYFLYYNPKMPVWVNKLLRVSPKNVNSQVLVAIFAV